MNRWARELLEGNLPPIWVAGEVSGWKRYASGHCYFTLRDSTAQLRCVMFRGDAARLPAEPEDGMEVRCFGDLTIYEQRGDFQLVVRVIEGAGAGGLWRLAFEQLRTRLEAEGLLAIERKRPLPPYPAVIGVVTSPAGAALQDILRILERRAPWTRVIVSPARVQGDGAADDIARAIRRLQHSGAELAIVGRGGGSVEDLWAFNEEPVARAIASCPVPVISAVGHEVDVSIADLVADVRAATPSAAAELAVPDREAVRRELTVFDTRIRAALRDAVSARRRETERIADRIERRIRHWVRAHQERLLRAAGKLEALSPLAALSRGYAVPLDRHGRVLRRIREFDPGKAFSLRVVDGRIECRVESRTSGEQGD